MITDQETRKKLYAACESFNDDVHKLWTEMRNTTKLVKKTITKPKMDKLKKCLDTMYNCNYPKFGENYDAWVLNTSTGKLTQYAAKTFLSDWLTVALKGPQSGLSREREHLWKISNPYLPSCALADALKAKKIKLDDYRKTKALILSQLQGEDKTRENIDMISHMTVETECHFLEKEPKTPLGDLTLEELTVLHILMMRTEGKY